ncbi:MAG: ABC transporter ATP-binding protein [Nitrospinota bacterium]|nr:MAG: ABC transporter ATP-binding protein [Nitrospinota bacterium]
MSVEVRDLYVGYFKDIAILQGVSLLAQTGKITTLIGPNGVGKSTLLKTIYGFLTPFQGQIVVHGEEITGMAPYLLAHKGISYIPQRRNVFPYLSVEENLILGAWIFRRDRERMAQALEENYRRFPQLREKRRQKAGTLSGGEQRMVELGRALMVSPTILLVDEPTAGLAPRVAGEIYARLQALNREEGKTILLVDQNIRQALRISDYVYVFELGRNRAEGPRERFETDLRELIRDWLF